MSAEILNRFFHPEYLVKKEYRLGDMPSGPQAYKNVLHIALPSVAQPDQFHRYDDGG